MIATPAPQNQWYESIISQGIAVLLSIGQSITLRNSGVQGKARLRGEWRRRQGRQPSLLLISEPACHAPRTTPRAASRPAATGAAVRRCIGAQLKTPGGGDARFVRLVGRLRIRKSSPGAAAARACSHTAARALRPARIPSARRRSRRRTAGPAGRDRAEEARDATQRGHPEVIARRNRASGTRPRVAVPGKWRPPARRALSSARRRSRQRTTGGGTGRRQRAARSALCHPTRARGIYRPEQPRHGRAGCASASR